MAVWVIRVLVLAGGLLGVAPVFAVEPSVYVVLDPQGQALVRAVVTPERSCPDLEVDGRPKQMRLRVEPPPAPVSPGQTASFPVRVCELELPPGATTVRFEHGDLPMPGRPVRKVVVLGDTGCRMKSPVSFQDCQDAEAWPLAQVARSAAAEHPDLVIHVGDYHYRESPCPIGGCTGSPHGYGWDTWLADFFEPMRPLLLAAPWVVTRGNHESCARAGQGWFRFLDPRPFDARQACEGAPPHSEDFTEPYAVTLEKGHQLIVFDSAGSPERELRPGSPVTETYALQFRKVAELARHSERNWLVLHHPILGYGYLPVKGYDKGNPALRDALLMDAFPTFLPDGVELVLQGHIHTFELNRFDGKVPLSLLAGFGGSTLEPAFPGTLPVRFQLAPGVMLADSVSSQEFGYVLLERNGQGWSLSQKDVRGQVRRKCRLGFDSLPRRFDCLSGP